MKLEPEVLSILSSCSVEGLHMRIAGQLDRKMYVKVNKALEAIGGKWSRKAKAHVFSEDPREALARALDEGEVETFREMGFFPTPPEIAAKMIEMAGVSPGDYVLEPSAGSGNIVNLLLDAGAHVLAVERDRKMRKNLTGMSMRIMVPSYDDFMDMWSGDREPFDAVVMNPPFAHWMEHIRHAFTMLSAGGVLVSVVPRGIRFRQDRRHREFREWYTSIDGSLEDLPDDSFRASGTSVRTCLLTVRSSAKDSMTDGT